MGGIINEIIWTPDQNTIIALGENKGQAASINPESGSKMGDVLGFTTTVLCAVITPEKSLFSAGEGNEILRHDMPFKG